MLSRSLLKQCILVYLEQKILTSANLPRLVHTILVVSTSINLIKSWRRKQPNYWLRLKQLQLVKNQCVVITAKPLFNKPSTQQNCLKHTSSIEGWEAMFHLRSKVTPNMALVHDRKTCVDKCLISFTYISFNKRATQQACKVLLS